MARAYSQDLRDRVIDAALGGLPARRAAAQFRIGLATAIRWVHRVRQTGDRTAGRQGQPRRSKLDPHRDYILGLVETTPDMTSARCSTSSPRSVMCMRLGRRFGPRIGPAKSSRLRRAVF